MFTRRLYCSAALLPALLAAVSLVAASPVAAAPEPRQVVLQPIVPPGDRVDAALVRRAVDLAAEWANQMSAGRTNTAWSHSLPALSIKDNTCTELIREAARDRQRRPAPSTLTLYVGTVTDCPYRAIAETPGSWVLVPRVTRQVDAWARTIAHELGHTLGLQHAGAQTCAVLTSSSTTRRARCTLDEYGDRTDPMGRGSLDWSLGPISRASLGWTALDSVAGAGVHDVTLEAEDAVSVTDPMSGVRYAIAYRTPGDGSDERSRGVHIYRVPTPGERDVASVHLPWIISPSAPWGGRAGMAFVAPSQAMALEVVSVAPEEARVRITLGEGITDEWGPAFMETLPALMRDGVLRVPRAFDQSGVARYVVRVDGRVVEERRASAGVSAWALRLSSRMAETSTVTVEAIDSAGNATVVRVR